MRYHCNFCGKSVTSELPDAAVIRATLICPECLERADPHTLEAALKNLTDNAARIHG
jgi:hypothetical protein